MAESCCNPFNFPIHNYNTRKKNLRVVKQWMCDKADISMGSKIYDSCRKSFQSLKQEQTDESEIILQLKEKCKTTYYKKADRE